MTRAKQTGKAARQTTAASTGPTAASDKGASMAPPPYGIAFVDRGPQAPAKRTGLPDALKAGIEQLSGLSLDAVKVHYNASQAGQVGAAAFAQGRHIHLAPGQAHHLPHEAWHVVQQAQGRVRPTAHLDGGAALNDELPLELEAEAMGAKALMAGHALAAGGAPAAALAPVAQAPGAATGGVIQRWPDWLDRLRGKGKNPHKRLVSEDEQLVDDAKAMGHRAQTHQATVEARRRDDVKKGLRQVAEEGSKMAVDALTVPTLGLSPSTIIGGVRTIHSIVSAASQVDRQGGSQRNAAKAGAAEVLKEVLGQAVSAIPVVGEFGGMVQGVAKATKGVVESDASRSKKKRAAIDQIVAERDLAEEARERLKGGDLTPAERSSLTEDVKRYDGAEESAKEYQDRKAAKGKLPLLTASVVDDEERRD